MSKFKLGEVLNKFEHLKRDLPQVLANDSVRFFNESFNKQAWDGVKWVKRKKVERKGRGTKKSAKALKTVRSVKSGRSILIKSGRLKRSIKVKSATFRTIKIISNTPYSEIHNEGFKGIEYVKPHKRRLFGKAEVQNVETKRKRKVKVLSGKTNVKGHARKMNMPKRQFMGDSKELTKQHVVKIEKALSTCFK